jgi:hypothetical protein
LELLLKFTHLDQTMLDLNPTQQSIECLRRSDG